MDVREKLVELLRKLAERIKYHMSHEWCYDRMEADGTATMGCCCGVVGGSKETDDLSEMCLDCPHWVPLEKEGADG